MIPEKHTEEDKEGEMIAYLKFIINFVQNLLSRN